MWLGVAAGLALLTLPFARLAHAQNISVDDQQLRYDGQGWGTFVAPQDCAGISGTVHSTSSSGDTVSYSFTGNAVQVYGPSTSGSPPMTVVLDNAVQPLAPVTQDGSGCGVLYSNSNIPDKGQQHLLVMMYTNPSDSGFSVSGIMSSNSDHNNSLPVQAAPVAPATISTPTSVPTTSSKTSTSSSTTSTSTSPASTDPSGASANAAGMDPSNNSTASPTSSGADSTSSVIETSEFVTTPGMTFGLIGAIVGAVLGMITLLVLFLFIRCRIARKSVLQNDQQTVMRTGRERDMEEGKRKVPLADDALSPAWRSKDVAPYASGWNADGSVIDVSGPAVPAAAASSTSRISAQRRSTRSASTTYTVNLAPAFLNEPPPPPRVAPASLTIPPNNPHSPTPPGLGTGGSSEVSQRSAPPPFSSDGAIWGADADEKAQGAYVVNRTDSNRSASTARTGPPPPGYI